jgi:uncharacterized protein (TIGR03437 family)
LNIQPLMPGFFLDPQEFVITTPVQPGEQVLLFATGFGPITPDNPQELLNAVKVQIATMIVDAAFAGLSNAGVYQFKVTVPDLPDGAHSVSAEVGGVRTAKIGRLHIQRG